MIQILFLGRKNHYYYFFIFLTLWASLSADSTGVFIWVFAAGHITYLSHPLPLFCEVCTCCRQEIGDPSSVNIIKVLRYGVLTFSEKDCNLYISYCICERVIISPPCPVHPDLQRMSWTSQSIETTRRSRSRHSATSTGSCLTWASPKRTLLEL